MTSKICSSNKLGHCVTEKLRCSAANIPSTCNLMEWRCWMACKISWFLWRYLICPRNFVALKHSIKEETDIVGGNDVQSNRENAFQEYNSVYIWMEVALVIWFLKCRCIQNALKCTSFCWKANDKICFPVSNYIFNIPTLCTLYNWINIFFLPNVSYMFRCVLHHLHGELCITCFKLSAFY